MCATGSVQALVGKDEALDGFSVHDVRFDDLVDVVGSDAAVPDLVWIDNHGWAVLTLIQASGHVGTDALFESAQSKFLLEEILELGLARGIAAAARMARFALVAADEKVPLELGHEFNVQDFAAAGVGCCQRFKVLSPQSHRGEFCKKNQLVCRVSEAMLRWLSACVPQAF